MTAPRVWLITGASSGFGRSLLDVVLNSGDIVVASLRKPDVLSDLTSKYSKDQLLVLKLDVTKEADIANAFSQIRDVFGRLDVVFNNAGIGAIGEIEATPQEVAKAIFDVNFWGATEISRAAVRFFREINPLGVGGMLLQVTSMYALQAGVCAGYYSASKYALEGFSEALANELDPKWNIQICMLEPGSFRTEILKTSPVMPQHCAYSDPSLVTSARRKLLLGAPAIGDTDKATKKIYEVVCRGNPALRFPIGKDAVRAARNKINNLVVDVDNVEKFRDSEDLLATE